MPMSSAKFASIACVICAMTIAAQIAAQDPAPAPTSPPATTEPAATPEPQPGTEPAATPVPPPPEPARPTRLRFRAGWVLAAEIAPENPGEMLTMANLSPYEEPQEPIPHPGYALVTVKLDQGRSISRFDYVLEDRNRKQIPAFAIRVGDGPYDAGPVKVSTDNPFRYCQLLFSLPMPDTERPEYRLRFKLFDDSGEAPLLIFRKVTSPGKFTTIAKVPDEGVVGVIPESDRPQPPPPPPNPQPTDKPTDSSGEKPAEKTVDKPADKPAVPPAEKTAEKPGDQTVPPKTTVRRKLQPELVVQFGFEDDAQAVTEAPFKGGKCLALKGNGAWMHHDIPLTGLLPDTEYRLTLALKKGPECKTQGDSAYAAVINYDQERKMDVYGAVGGNVPCDNTWHEVTVDFKTTASLKQCSVYLYNKDTTDTMWVDEVRIDRLK